VAVKKVGGKFCYNICHNEAAVTEAGGTIICCSTKIAKIEGKIDPSR
jgi:hypothetical protein